MTGGLMQITTYGSQDLYLTGTPEITFFKIVYRRHTNFAMESINIPFDDQTGFGQTSTVVLPKVGDLIHKIYLAITLPEVTFLRTPPGSTFSSALLTAQKKYLDVTNFMTINIQAYRIGIEEYNSENTTAQDMLNSIDDVFNLDNFSSNVKIPFEQALFQTPFIYSNISIQDIINNYKDNNNVILPNVTKQTLLNVLNVGIKESIVVQGYFSTQITNLKALIAESINPNAQFSWVKRLGHAIIDMMEISIGGDVIDKHYGHWLNVWYELTGNNYMDDVYFKMIGDVPELTEINRATKPKYTMYIPLQFWFCRHNGLSLPLIALEYHDVGLKITLKKFEECCYLSDLGNTSLTFRTSLIRQLNISSLADFVEESGTDLEASLYVDYIYLDSSERKKFAQSSHEYLIEQLQFIEFDNVTSPMFQEVLNFYHPCKEIIWTSQNSSAISSIDGFTLIDIVNYTVDVGTLIAPQNINPILSSSIEFNSLTRIDQIDSVYFNYIQPYQCHTRSPNIGINVYSFALFPEEHQPSGTCNLGVISRVLLKLNFDPRISENNIELTVRVYAVNYNILRFISGMGGISYTR